jgi:hypothetical protein
MSISYGPVRKVTPLDAELAGEQVIYETTEDGQLWTSFEEAAQHLGQRRRKKRQVPAPLPPPLPPTPMPPTPLPPTPLSTQQDATTPPQKAFDLSTLIDQLEDIGCVRNAVAKALAGSTQAVNTENVLTRLDYVIDALRDSTPTADLLNALDVIAKFNYDRA